jgi:hypothetical protein
MLWYNVRAAIAIRTLMHSMREGRPINHRENWRVGWRVGAATIAAVLFLGVASISFSLVQIASYQWIETLPPVNDNTLIMRLADIEQDTALERRTHDFDAPYRNNADFLNCVQRGWSLYAPTQYKVKESGIVKGRRWLDNSGEYTPSSGWKNIC